MSLQVFAVLFILAVLWGSAFPGIKLGLEGFSAAHLTLLRHLVASACMLPLLIAFKSRLRPARRDLGRFFLLGLLGYTIYHTALNYGELRVSAGAASLIIATAPAFTAIVAYFLLSERLPRWGWLGIGLSFIGVVLIVLGDSSSLSLNPYALLILLSAIVTAFFAVLQKPLLGRYSAVEVTAFATWLGTLPMLLYVPGFFSSLYEASALPLGAAIYIGVVPSAIAYTLFAYAISKAEVTLVATFLYSVPVFSMLFSWWLLDEVPSWLTLVGGGVAIAGIALVQQSKRARRSRLARAGAD